ncbi:ATP-binding protein [Streptomyces diastatochromogenes]|nr:ATP-binding protein [Streptomyces diastatochromogenes]
MIALLVSSERIRTPVAWCGLVAVLLTAATSAVVARRTRAQEADRHTRARVEAAEGHAEREAALLARLDDQRAAVAWLAEELLPVAITRLHRATRLGGPARRRLREAPRPGLHRGPQGGPADLPGRRRGRGAHPGRLPARPRGRRPQGPGDRAPARQDLHAMQILHGNDLVVSRGLQAVDHRNALIGRLAASVAVLGDARPGRQWSKAIPLYDVLRGAMSRIVDYPRVKLQSVAEVAVTGPGAEPLMHLLAELLDNATTFSPPHTPVEVTASEVPSGIAIEIEDRGVGLTEEVRRRVERVMAQSRTGVNLSGLGELTQIGLPVVSRLAREHGCEVDLRTSAYGGVRAVVLVPRTLITTVPPSALLTPEILRRRARPRPAPPDPGPRRRPGHRRGQEDRQRTAAAATRGARARAPAATARVARPDPGRPDGSRARRRSGRLPPQPWQLPPAGPDVGGVQRRQERRQERALRPLPFPQRSVR